MIRLLLSIAKWWPHESSWHPSPHIVTKMLFSYAENFYSLSYLRIDSTAWLAAATVLFSASPFTQRALAEDLWSAGHSTTCWGHTEHRIGLCPHEAGSPEEETENPGHCCEMSSWVVAGATVCRMGRHKVESSTPPQCCWVGGKDVNDNNM